MLELERASNAAFDELMRALRRVKFDPEQPRDDQGRWSNTGSNGLADLSTVFAQGGPDDSWESVASSFDGVNVVEQLVTNQDGSAIRSQYTTDPASPWDERHTVATRDGTRISFENSRETQTIRDASTGRAISAATWTADGAQPEATVQPAFVQAYAVEKSLEARGPCSSGLVGIPLTALLF